MLAWNLYLSNLLTIALVTLWNFGMNARFNWTADVPCVSPSDEPGSRDSGCDLQNGTKTRQSTASSHGKLLPACIVWGLLFSLCLRSNAANLAPDEAVRDFLLNPPVISEAKFVIHREGFHTEWYICKRQANAAFVRWCVDSNEFYNVESPAQNRVAAFYDSYHWCFHRGALTEWQDRGRLDETNNVVKREFDSYSTVLHLLMSLGISWTPLDTLTLSNDFFSFTIPGGIVEGSLHFENGKLVSAEALYPVGPGRPVPAIRRKEYRYATAFPDFPFLPSAWTLYAKRPGKDLKWIKLEECAITSISGKDAPLSSAAFSPEAAGITVPDQVFWVQGTNVMYYDPLRATNRMLRSVNDPLAVKHHGKSSRLVYIGLAILLVLPLGAVAWRAVASKYRRTNTK